MPLPNEFIVYGSEETIKPLILQLLAQHYDEAGSNGDTGGGSYQRLPSYVKGQIFITLRFYGTTQAGKQHFVYKSFRWVKVDPRTVSPESVMQMGMVIKTKFNNFKFVTGIEAFTYNNPDQGFNRVWGYFRDSIEAKRLFESMLDLQSFPPDWKRFTKSSVVEPGDRFQNPPEKVQQAGINVRTEDERPTATVAFNGAFIKFPHVKDKGVLVSSNGLIMDPQKFLSKYTD